MRPFRVTIIFASLLMLDPSPAPGQTPWKPVAVMSEQRASHTATLLHDGRVLIAGGFRKGEEGRGQVFLNSAEMYDPTAKKFSTTADMTFSRA
ncbi:MAG: kelch repeat-containing protein, partial [Bacteroidota bacterium]